MLLPLHCRLLPPRSVDNFQNTRSPRSLSGQHPWYYLPRSGDYSKSLPPVPQMEAGCHRFLPDHSNTPSEAEKQSTWLSSEQPPIVSLIQTFLSYSFPSIASLSSSITFLFFIQPILLHPRYSSIHSRSCAADWASSSVSLPTEMLAR